MKKINKKLKKKIMYISVALVLVIIVSFAFFRLQNVSFGLEDVQQNFEFDSINGTAYAPTFESVSNTATYFCNSKDGGVTISNSLSDGESLMLSTSHTSAGSGCSDTNHIYADFDLPAGTLYVEWSGTASETNDGASRSELFISSDAVNIMTKIAIKHDECSETGKNYYWRVANCNPSLSNETQFIFTEPVSIRVEIKSHASNTGSATSNLILNFVENENPLDCINDEERCNGTLTQICVSNFWNAGSEVNGSCGFVIDVIPDEGYNCTEDTSKICLDNSTIIIQNCTSGVLVNTSNTCPPINTTVDCSTASDCKTTCGNLTAKCTDKLCICSEDIVVDEPDMMVFYIIIGVLAVIIIVGGIYFFAINIGGKKRR